VSEIARLPRQSKGRSVDEVIGYMSGNQQAPDMMCEIFVLAPTDSHGD
jgi:hypothetical protein